MTSCGNPNVEKDALMERRPKYDGKTKICVKCKENQGNVVIRHAVYCKSCFFPLVQTRFKRTLEPSINPAPDGPRRKALRAAGSLAVGFSGGTCSMTLLDLVAKTYLTTRPTGNESMKGGTDHPRNSERGVWKGKPTVCYVEVCGAFSGQIDQTEVIRAIVERYPNCPFEFIPLRLEDSFNPSWWSSVGGGNAVDSARSFGLDISDEELRLTHISQSTPPDSSALTALKAYLSSVPTLTAVNSTIQTLIRLLLFHTAAAHNASHLLLGTSLTSLSVNLISGIAQGSGFAVAEEAKEEWTPRPARGLPVRVVRPLRDVGVKECAIWNWWAGLHPVDRPWYPSGAGKNAVDSLTRDFIFGLETDYPATVSTIARTCGKLASKEDSDERCILCERPAQRRVQDWKAQISIRSYSDATPAVSGITKPTHLSDDEISNLTQAKQESKPEPSLAPYLCYACHTTLTSRSIRGMTAPLSAQRAKETPLPMWVRSTLDGVVAKDSVDSEMIQSKKLTSQDIKSQIEQYLIDE
ncbi:hypothetical protein CPB83DRAFT_902530 [Crepidotus variabilis]|uniref:Cytoplasmic tRNA 2-thiolation protein 2 n=1 Tax=Crepidotus variabilis TaxID=179855 RepID=A0A9P6JVV4_9AGAR|nr:hypothetical protein CPB83DRAFT_902530 [Crepidotus variabilis]